MREINVVDKDDKLIGSKNIDMIDWNDIYQVASLWVENSIWQVLLAQRSFTKKHHPWKWWPIVEGTLEKGCSYKEKIVSRSREEVWLHIHEQDLVPREKIRITTPYNHFNQPFLLDHKVEDISEFTINTDEIHAIKWWDKKQLIEEIQHSPEMFVGSLDKFI